MSVNLPMGERNEQIEGGDKMEKLRWTKPVLTEISVNMTRDDKVGTEHDQFTDAAATIGIVLDGKLRPDGSCCCS